MCTKHNPVFCSIVPSHVLRNIAERGNEEQRNSAFRAMSMSSRIRGRRDILNNIAIIGAVPAGVKRRTVYNAKHNTTLPGAVARTENGPASSDTSANEAFIGSGKTYDFYQAVFNRNSIDDKGMRLDSTVHYDENFNNAFWNGQQMIYGDGDGVIFTRFTKVLDVIGHELTHGITQYEADLNYEGQSGALNEHFSDVFGSLVKQYATNQTATQADWLIGKGLLGPTIHGIALRSMKAPGTAYNDPHLGHDPQPAHMKHFVETDEDNGGVHINSGIPNKAFSTLAVGLGGRAWERAGRIWYTTLCNELSSNATFQDATNKTYKVARDLYGATVANKVRDAWKAVGLTVSTTMAIKSQPAQKKPPTKKGTAGKGGK